MKMWKKVLIICSAILLVAIACIISWSYGFRQGIRAGGLTSSMAELTLINQHMANQIENANCEGVRQSINEYLQIIEKYKHVKEGLITETTYHGDRMLGYMRLARIEEYLGNKAEVRKHITAAKEACIQYKWKDCSEEKLVSFMKKLEEKHPIGCLSKK